MSCCKFHWAGIDKPVSLSLIPIKLVILWLSSFTSVSHFFKASLYGPFPYLNRNGINILILNLPLQELDVTLTEGSTLIVLDDFFFLVFSVVFLLVLLGLGGIDL